MTTINLFLSYVIDAVLLINSLIIIALISRLRWVSALLSAITFYIGFAYCLITVGADFIGILYFIIYLGAIMTLFLFAIMFLHLTIPAFIAPMSIYDLFFTEVSILRYTNLYKFILSFLFEIFLLSKLGLLYCIFDPKTSTAFSGVRQRILDRVNNLRQVRLQQKKILFVQPGKTVFYTLLFIGIVIITQSLLLYYPSVFNIFSENIFYFFGSCISIISNLLYTDYQLEFLLVGFSFWIAFIAVLILLHKPKSKNN